MLTLAVARMRTFKIVYVDRVSKDDGRGPRKPREGKKKTKRKRKRERERDEMALEASDGLDSSPTASTATRASEKAV